jgi:hypothetical protein
MSRFEPDRDALARVMDKPDKRVDGQSRGKDAN